MNEHGQHEFMAYEVCVLHMRGYNDDDNMKNNNSGSGNNINEMQKKHTHTARARERESIQSLPWMLCATACCTAVHVCRKNGHACIIAART